MSDNTDADGGAHSETQEVVEQVDKKLQKALKNANTYVSHDKVRPSAVTAFDLVEKAREELDKIDEREFTKETDE